MLKNRGYKVIATILTIALIFTSLPVLAASAEDLPLTSVSTDNVQVNTEPYILFEDVDKRDANTKHFKMSDGSYQAVVYPYAVNFKSDNEFKEIDNSLIKSDNSDYYTNKSNKFNVELPTNLNENSCVKINNGEYSVLWSFDAKSSSIKTTNKNQNSIEKRDTSFACAKGESAIYKANDEYLKNNGKALSRAEYNNVYDNIDVCYDLIGEQLKESIIINKITKKASFCFNIECDGLIPELNDDGSISFKDKNNNNVFYVQAPYMFDANGESSTDIDVTLNKTHNGYEYTIIPNKKWLKDKARVYPVTIDPTIIPEYNFKSIKDSTASFSSRAVSDYAELESEIAWLKVGRRENVEVAALLYVELPDTIPQSATIVKATLALCGYRSTISTCPTNLQLNVHKITSDWNQTILTSTVLYSDSNPPTPSYDSTVIDYAIINDSQTTYHGSWTEFDITKIVQEWRNGETNRGVMIKASSYPSSNNFARFYDSDHSLENSDPTYIFYYRDTVGLEDYWSYSEFYAGERGNTFVNNFNGNLTYVHNDVSFISEINGFTLSHIYNSANAICSVCSANQTIKYGSGWHLNLVQHLQNVSVSGNSSVKYVYTDGDGTDHYFVELSDGSIVDEDGLGYTYASLSGEGELSSKITDKDGNVLKFDIWGDLRKIIDTNGNTISLNYSPIPNVDNYLSSITTSSGGVFALNYDSNYQLTSITDNSGRSVTFSYTNGFLKHIYYPDGTGTHFAYDEGNTNAMTVLQHSSDLNNGYSYDQNKRIVTVTQNGNAGVSGTRHTFNYKHNQTVVTDNKQRSMTYQFDTEGRVTCAYDSDGNSYSQSYNTSDTAKSNIFKNNKIQVSSNNTRYNNNLLYDGAFTFGLANWLTYKDLSSAKTELVSNEGYISLNTVKHTATEVGTTTVFQRLNNLNHSTYTVTAYVKTVNVESASNGAGIELYTSESRYLYSDFISGTTDTDINNGFKKLIFTVTLNHGETLKSVGVGLFNATGTMYVDCVQLEVGDTSNNINLLSDSDFEYDTVGSTSPLFFTNCMNGAVSSTAYSGSKSFRIIGTPAHTIYSSQVIALNGKKGDVYSFGAWGKANSVPHQSGDESVFKIIVQLYSGDEVVKREVAEFNEYVSDWQFTSNIVIADKPHDKIMIHMGYYNTCNTAYFDNVFLYRDTAQSYSYDSNGNVITTADKANQQSNYQYSSNSLSKIISPTGTSYEYAYDTNKNTVFSKSSEGIRADIDYTSQGNPVDTITGADNYSASLQSGKTYYIRLKNTGKYLTVADASTQNYASIVQHNFSGSANQRWILEDTGKGGYYLHPEHSPDKSLHITNSVNNEETPVSLYTTIGTDQQIFKITPQSDFTYTFSPKTSPDGKIVSVNYSATQNNVTIISPYGTLNPGQSWYFEDTSIEPIDQIEDGAVYAFRARNSGKYIDVSYGNVSVGTEVFQYELNHNKTQRFQVKKYGETDYYTFTPLNATDKLLQVSTDTEENGCTYLQLGDSTVNDRKLFKFVYYSQHQGFQIIPKHNENLALDVANGSISNTGNLIFTGISNAINRYFIAEKIHKTINSSVTYQDNGNFIHTIKDSRGNVTTYGFDTSRGLQTSVTDAKNNITSYTYNANNDRLEAVAQGNSNVGYEYYAFGGLKKITAPSGTAYNFSYDKYYNTSAISVGTQTLSEYIYNDNNGPLKQMRYGNGNVVDYTYDNFDRITQTAYNNSVKNKYKYDKSGNLYQKQDLFVNITSQYLYDLSGRIQEARASDGSSISYKYDEYNRVKSYIYTANGVTNKTQYIYGNASTAGQKVDLLYGVKHNDIQTLSYSYDALCRVDTRTVHTTAPFVTRYSYLDGADVNSTTALVENMQVGEDTYCYAYDALGNIESVSKNGTVIESYTYDSLNQLKTLTNANGVYEYTYDNGGNILSVTLNGESIKSYTYGNANWKDQLTAYNGQAITYDEIGNPLSYKGNTLSWQNGRQLTGITNAQNTINYTYNADGNRTSKTVNGVTTDYYWLEGVLLGQKTGDDYIVYLYDENGIAYGLICNNTYYYYVFNLQGDVIGIIDSNGNKVVEYTYTAWGEVLSITGSQASTIGQLNPVRYRGYYYDGETGFYLTGTRYYDPEIGRFINADGEISDVGGNILGYNLFAYCFNNPVNMDDPTGQWPKWLTGALNVVSGVAQMAAGAALGAFTSWTGVGAVAAGFLIVNGAATATQGIGQIVNDVTKTNVLREDNIIRTAVKDVGRAIGGDTGAKITGGAYDVAAVAANLYAGKVGLQQTGLAPIKVNINKVLNNPMDEFVTCGPAPGVISDYCRLIPLNGYGKIYATQLPNGFYQLANGHHRVAALRSLGKETIKIFLTK